MMIHTGFGLIDLTGAMVQVVPCKHGNTKDGPHDVMIGGGTFTQVIYRHGNREGAEEVIAEIARQARIPVVTMNGSFATPVVDMKEVVKAIEQRKLSPPPATPPRPGDDRGTPA